MGNIHIIKWLKIAPSLLKTARVARTLLFLKILFWFLFYYRRVYYYYYKYTVDDKEKICAYNNCKMIE